MSNGYEYKRLSTNNCVFVGIHNKVAYIHTIECRRHQHRRSLPRWRVAYAPHFTLYTVFFISSPLACVYVCLTLIHHTPVIIIITITKEHLTEKFLNVNECECWTMILWGVDTAKTHASTRTYKFCTFESIKMNESEKNKVLQIVKWENEWMKWVRDSIGNR